MPLMNDIELYERKSWRSY